MREVVERVARAIYGAVSGLRDEPPVPYDELSSTQKKGLEDRAVEAIYPQPRTVGLVAVGPDGTRTHADIVGPGGALMLKEGDAAVTWFPETWDDPSPLPTPQSTGDDQRGAGVVCATCARHYTPDGEHRYTKCPHCDAVNND